MSHPLVSMPLVAIEQANRPNDHIDRQKMDNRRIDFYFFFGQRRRLARRSRSTSIDTISWPLNRWQVECKSF